MFDWLKRGKSDNPLADAKNVREIVDGLPPYNAVKALEEISGWLESLNHDLEMPLPNRFDAVDVLDTAAKNRQRKLLQDYLAVTRQQKFQEHQMWNAAHGCWRNLEEGYRLCIMQAVQGGSGATVFRKSLPVAVARALRSITLQLKWILLRYGTVESRLWQELARLYEAAEKGGFVDAVCAVYPGAHGAGSVKREFLKTLMLAVSSTDSLVPQRQEVAERLVAHFGPLFHLGGTDGQDCHFGFDLAAGRAPGRARWRAEAAPTMRYFGAGEALAKLNDLVALLERGGSLPEAVHVGGQYERELLLAVMRHLQTYWSEAMPARASERRVTITRATVLPGLEGVLATLDPSEDDTLDFREQPAAESWIVENVSEGGCGAVVPGQSGDWVRIGGLVGMRGEIEQYWSIGLIRRVTRDEHQQRRVGVQTLTRMAILARIAHPGIAGECVPAVVLQSKPDAAGEVGLLLRAGFYNSRDSLEMTVGSRTYLLIPSKVVEAGEDFDWAKFRVMQKSD